MGDDPPKEYPPVKGVDEQKPPPAADGLLGLLSSPMVQIPHHPKDSWAYAPQYLNLDLPKYVK